MKPQIIQRYPLFVIFAFFVLYAIAIFQVKDLRHAFPPTALGVIISVAILDYIWLAAGILLLEIIVMILMMHDKWLNVIFSTITMNIVSSACIYIPLLAWMMFRYPLGLPHYLLIPIFLFSLFYKAYDLHPPDWLMAFIAISSISIAVPTFMEIHNTYARHPYNDEIMKYVLMAFSFLPVFGVSILIEAWVCRLFNIRKYWLPLFVANICSYLFIVIVGITSWPLLLINYKGCIIK